jgi:mRNA interferase MazF
MPIFEQGDIVRIPFPYTDRSTRQHRPALVVSRGALGEAGALLWVVMITSAENRVWPGDVVIADHVEAGLPAPSVIRPAKIATIEAGHAERVGQARPAEIAQAMATIRASIGAD